MTEPQRAGVLVVSLWLEGSTPTIRARVTETPDINAVGEMTNVVGSIEELLAAVERWATAFIDQPSDTPDEDRETIMAAGAATSSGPAADAPE